MPCNKGCIPPPFHVHILRLQCPEPRRHGMNAFLSQAMSLTLNWPSPFWSTAYAQGVGTLHARGHITYHGKCLRKSLLLSSLRVDTSCPHAAPSWHSRTARPRCVVPQPPAGQQNTKSSATAARSESGHQRPTCTATASVITASVLRHIAAPAPPRALPHGRAAHHALPEERRLRIIDHARGAYARIEQACSLRAAFYSRLSSPATSVRREPSRHRASSAGRRGTLRGSSPVVLRRPRSCRLLCSRGRAQRLSRTSADSQLHTLISAGLKTRTANVPNFSNITLVFQKGPLFMCFFVL
jgi:hypothetical protein